MGSERGSVKYVVEQKLRGDFLLVLFLIFVSAFIETYITLIATLLLRIAP